MIRNQENNILTKSLPLLLTFFSIALTVFIPDASRATTGDLTLKGVQIVETNQTNLPPQAVSALILVSKTPFTVSFDATASSDPDGSITEYRWDFGDGATGTGLKTNHTYTDRSKIYDGTLMVKDDKGGVSLAHNAIDYAALLLQSAPIKDSFSVNTIANYTSILGLLSISGEKAHGKTWAKTIAHHNSTLTSADHWVQADVSYNGLYDSGGVAVRVDPSAKTGYATYIQAGKIYLHSFAGSQATVLAQYDGKYQAGTYTVKLECVGSTLTVYVNGALVITKSDITYPSGKNIGLRIARDIGNADIVVDNLFAGESN